MRFWELKQLYENGTDRAQIHAAIEEMGYDAAEERDRISTLLHMAAKYADAELLKKLLEAGADVNAKNSYGEHALFCLADPFERFRPLPSEEKRACADLLLEAGASVMARSEGDGQTALELAADWDNEPLVKLILMNS